MSKNGVFFGPNERKYGPEKTPYFDTFHAVYAICQREQKFFIRSFYQGKQIIFVRSVFFCLSTHILTRQLQFFLCQTVFKQFVLSSYRTVLTRRGTVFGI